MLLWNFPALHQSTFLVCYRCSSTQESKGIASKWTRALAACKGGKNAARNFFKHTSLPVDWVPNFVRPFHIALLCFQPLWPMCYKFQRFPGYGLPCEEPIWVKIAVLDDKKDGTQFEKDMPVLLPHHILRFLFTEAGVHINEGVIQRFWQHLHEVQHPLSAKVAGSHDFIPVGIHGDEAAYGADRAAPDKLTCIFMDLPLWRPKNARLSRFLLFAMDSAQLVGYESLHPVLQHIAESLNFAYFGVDAEGMQIFTGHRFILSELRGDQVWHKYLWRHLRWWRAREVCFRCCAVARDGPLYWEFGDQAAWRSTEISTIDFLVEGLPDDLLCPLALCHGFDISTIQHCSMHTVNLGLAFTFSGSTLYNLLNHGWFGSPQSPLADRLNLAYDDFRQYCKLVQVRCSQKRFRVSTLLKRANGPCLTTKAFNARVIVSWIASCAMDASLGHFPRNRIFGQWLQQEGSPLPADDFLAPQAVAVASLARWFSLTEQLPRLLLLCFILFSLFFLQFVALVELPAKALWASVFCNERFLHVAAPLPQVSFAGGGCVRSWPQKFGDACTPDTPCCPEGCDSLADET